MVQKGNSLDCLSQTHLISQNAISVLIPTANQPIQTLQLKWFQLPVVLENWDIFVSVLSWLNDLFFCIFAHIKSVKLGLHVSDVAVGGGWSLLP